MQDEPGNVRALRLRSHEPSSGMLELADLFEQQAKLIREGKIIAAGFVSVDTDSEIYTRVNYDTRGYTLLGGVTGLQATLSKMLD